MFAMVWRDFSLLFCQVTWNNDYQQISGREVLTRLCEPTGSNILDSSVGRVEEIDPLQSKLLQLGLALAGDLFFVVRSVLELGMTGD